MTGTQKLIDRIVEDYAECRWMDASELRKYLEDVTECQKREMIQRAVRVCRVAGLFDSEEGFSEEAMVEQFRQVMEE